MATHQQACDNCRCRKIKCDRLSPCRNCVDTSLSCRYVHVTRRRGPRQGVGRRIAQLRRGLTEPVPDAFHVVTPGDVVHDVRPRVDCSPGTPSPGPVADAAVSTAGDTTRDTAGSGQTRQLARALTAHIHIFQRYMFPIMPVVDSDELLADTARLDQLAPSRYALIAALCAATRLQLRLDSQEDSQARQAQTPRTQSSVERELDIEIPAAPRLTGPMLLSIAEMALCQSSVVDDESHDSTLASFFLFAGYGNLNNARRAWFYLSQSISLAQANQVCSDDGCAGPGPGLSVGERELRRRIFWLLFVTERTFALQHRRSVMIRSRVPKPRVVDSECPTVMHDFVNHIRLFSLLPCSLYDWCADDDDDDDMCGPPLSSSSKRHSLPRLSISIHAQLCALQPESSLIQSQRFDSLVTQQWLRVQMWRLTFGNKPGSAHAVHCRDLPMRRDIPFDAGKVVMTALDSASLISIDCHGIAMEQKLFDLGTCLVDSTAISLPASQLSSREIGPRDLLRSVIAALSNVGGKQSHLLPSLLQYSETVLDCGIPITPSPVPTPSRTSLQRDLLEDFDFASMSQCPVTDDGSLRDEYALEVSTLDNTPSTWLADELLLSGLNDYTPLTFTYDPDVY